MTDPLVHFILLGSLVFLFYRMLKGPSDERVLVLRASTEARLRSDLERSHGRAPTKDEWESARQKWLTREALYREGLRLGLDKNDPAIRQQVINNLREIQLRSLPEVSPEPVELERYVREHAKRYAGTPERYNFEQFFFERSDGALALEWLAFRQGHGKRPNIPDAKAPPASSQRKDHQRNDTQRKGTQHQDEQAGSPAWQVKSHSSRDRGYIEAVFGEAFFRELSQMVFGNWKLIESSHGLHLVHLGHTSGGPPDPAAVRERALRDYRDEQRQKALERADQRILEQYEVKKP